MQRIGNKGFDLGSDLLVTKDLGASVRVDQESSELFDEQHSFVRVGGKALEGVVHSLSLVKDNLRSDGILS